MSKDQDFVEEGSKMIHEVVNNLELTLLNIPKGTLILKLTPKSINRTANLKFFVPRASISIPGHINKDLYVLDSHQTKDSYGTCKTINIYEGGLKFPLGKLSDKSHTIIELTIYKTALSKLTLVQKPGESNQEWTERSARISEAYGYDRYWSAVPSSLSSKIQFEGLNNILIADREYARSLAEYNGLEGGVWFSKKHRIKLKLAHWLSALICIIGFLSGIIALASFDLSILIVAIVGGGLGGLLFLICYFLITFIPKKDIEPL